MERNKGREVIDRETESEVTEREREKGRKQRNFVFVLLFADTVY